MQTLVVLTLVEKNISESSAGPADSEASDQPGRTVEETFRMAEEAYRRWPWAKLRVEYEQLRDPEAVVGHLFRTRFDTYDVPLPQFAANQLRMARKNFTYGVWRQWVERHRQRHEGPLEDRLADMQRGRLNAQKDGIESGTLVFRQQWQLDETGNWPNFKEDEDGDQAWDLVQDRDHNPVNEITDITNTTGPAWTTPTY